jgi:hypothetical protein
MLPTRFEEISAEDVQRLVDLKIVEHRTLEYKEKLASGNREERAEFLSDISSFANASGGDIIFGIAEERSEDGKTTGIPGSINRLDMENPAIECARIEQMIESGIQPRIPLVRVRSIDIPDIGPIILIRVEKSWIAPHMVTFSNLSRFFSRNSSTGKFQLDVQQIGAAFTLQRGLGEKLRNWKADRISKAIAESGPVPMQGPKLLLQLVSGASLASDDSLLPRRFDPQSWGRLADAMSLSGNIRRYNTDGYLIASENVRDGLRSYLQVFRDGSLEYGDSYAMDSHGGNHIASQLFEEKLGRTFKLALALLRQLGVTTPIFVTLCLLGVKGKTMALPERLQRIAFSHESDAFDRDLIVCPDVLLDGDLQSTDVSDSMLPLVDSIWQAAGRESTPYKDDDGRWLFA